MHIVSAMPCHSDNDQDFSDHFSKADVRQFLAGLLSLSYPDIPIINRSKP